MRDPGFIFDTCPECGAGVWEGEERGHSVYRCKEDPDLCGWVLYEEDESNGDNDDVG